MASQGLTNRERRYNYLRNCEFLQTLDDEEIQQVMEHGKFKTFSPFKQVIKQGKEGTSFYILLEGRVNVMKIDSNGKKHLITAIQEGDFFGEISLLLKKNRTATVISEVECEVFELKESDLKNFTSAIREKLFYKFAVTLSKRLKEMTTWQPGQN